MKSLGDVIVNGRHVPADTAAVSVFDIAVQRGYGCFEAMRSYGGRPFRLAEHLDRLDGSAARLGLTLPARSELEEWVIDRASAGGDCVVRLIVTGGTSLLHPGTGSAVVVFAEPIPPVPDGLKVLPVPAPWHTDGTPWALTGAKTLSYAPNVAASLVARRDGYDDALLLGSDELVLEGPTYSVAWVIHGVFETPSLDVGILASITRAAAIEAAGDEGIPVREGSYRLGRLLSADEVMCLSTVKEVRPITAVADHDFAPGPVTATIAAAYAALVRRAAT